MSRRYTQVSQKASALREKFWPELTDAEIWIHKDHGGFTSIPRTMPIIMNIIDDLTKGRPASSTYFGLWCKAYKEMYVPLTDHEEFAFHAGFTGQRAVKTWQDRMKSLADLGFVKVAEGPRGGLSHAAIPNPHFVIRRLHRDGYPGLTAAAFNSLIERGNDVVASDLEKQLPEDVKADDQIPF